MSILFKTLTQWDNDNDPHTAQDVLIVSDSNNEAEYAKIADGENPFSALPWRTIPGASIVRATGRILLRRNVASDVVLAEGEMAVDTENDTLIFKIGDGSHTWSQLPSLKAYIDGEIADVAADVANISAVIPSAATSSNKLTDKAYVDSNIFALDTRVDTIEDCIPPLTSSENYLVNEIMLGTTSDIAQAAKNEADAAAAVIPNNAAPNNKLITENDLDSEIGAVESAIEDAVGPVRSDVNNIIPLIPVEADESNKLADQALVDSKIATAISAVYRYKGSVATYQNLPSTGLTAGDVYNVEDTGDNYAWTGTEWDKLAGTVDLSSYATKSYVDGTITTFIAEYNVTSIANIQAAITAGKAVFCHYAAGAINMMLPLVDSGATAPVDYIAFAGLNDRKQLICVNVQDGGGSSSWSVEYKSIVYQIPDFLTSSSAETYTSGEMNYWANLYANGAVVCVSKIDSSQNITNYVLNHVDINSGTSEPESFDFYALSYVSGKLTVKSAVCNVSNGYFTESSAEAIPVDGGKIKDTNVDIDLTVENKKIIIPPASSSNYGVVKTGSHVGTQITNGYIGTANASLTEISDKTNKYRPIVPYTLDYAIKVGVTTNTNPLTTAEKKAACNWLGAEKQWRKLIDKTLAAADEAREFTFTTDDNGDAFILSRAKIFVFSPIDTSISQTMNGYVNVRSADVDNYSINYGAIVWKSNDNALISMAEIITDPDLPTRVEFNTNTWAATAKSVANQTAWGGTLTTHKQIQGIKFFLNGLSEKFIEGTRIVIFGIDK